MPNSAANRHLTQRIYSRFLRVAEYSVIILGYGYIWLFIMISFLRLVYPFELEWIEGAHIDQIRWILDGNPLYAEPTISFIPSSYTPLYFYLSAGLMSIVGVGFTAGRLVSILSSIGIFILLYGIVKTKTRSKIAGLISAGIYASAYRFTGAWMDLTKTDSLFLLLILIAFFVDQKYASRRGRIISGVVFVLAYYTKQVALPIILIYAVFSVLPRVPIRHPSSCRDCR